tara:strand:- start:218 stop:511 length:294 start_codon:yes stop_codon:yes gene_type:complete
MIREKYTYVTDESKQWQCIGLTEKAGFYQGVVYRYGKVSIPQTEEMTEEGDLPFRFEYDIVDSNGLGQEHFGEAFFTLIGDILVDIITNEEQRDTDN